MPSHPGSSLTIHSRARAVGAMGSVGHPVIIRHRGGEVGLHQCGGPSQKHQVIRLPAKGSAGKALTCLAHHRAESGTMTLNMGSPLSA